MKLHNRKRTLSMFIKLIIAALTGWYIYGHFAKHPAQNEIISGITDALNEQRPLFIFVLLLMPVNWMLESMKWKLLASRVEPISFYRALQGVLAGVTIGTATPNRVGEFAGRIYSVNSPRKKDLLLLSFIASFCQVLVTVLVAVIFLFLSNGELDVQQVLFVAGILLIVLLISYPFITGRLPERWRKQLEILQNFPKEIFFRVLFLSFIRYSVYVTQFVILLKIGYPRLDIFQTIASITMAYFIITIIPTFSITEILVRGSVAGLFIGNGDRLSDIAFYSSALLWTINVAVPSLIGIYFLFRLKFFAKE